MESGQSGRAGPAVPKNVALEKPQEQEPVSNPDLVAEIVSANRLNKKTATHTTAKVS